MTPSLPDVLFPASTAVRIPTPARTPRSLLPEPTLRALALDGALVPIGWGYQPIDLPTTPTLRAASIAPRVPDALAPGLTVVGGRTAAWLWGAEARLEEPLTIFIRPGGRMPAVDQPGAHLYGTELDDAEIVSLGELLVTSPVRTAIDLLRTPPRRFEEQAVVRLLEERRIPAAEIRAALVAGRRLPNRRLALARIQLLLTR